MSGSNESGHEKALRRIEQQNRADARARAEREAREAREQAAEAERRRIDEERRRRQDNA